MPRAVRAGAIRHRRSAGAAASTAPVAGQEIAQVSYWPTAAQTNATSTATALTDLATAAVTATWTTVVATTFDLTFTVPANGNVLIRMEASRSLSAAQNEDWALYDVGGAALVTLSEQVVHNSTARARAFYSKRITGLTPAASVTYRWQQRMQSAATATYYAGGTNGPLRMQAFACL